MQIVTEGEKNRARKSKKQMIPECTIFQSGQ